MNLISGFKSLVKKKGLIFDPNGRPLQRNYSPSILKQKYYYISFEI